MSRKKNSYNNIVSKGERQDNGCLVLTKNQKKNGYCYIGYDNKDMPAHRAVFLAKGNTIPPGYDVHHKCNNKPCIEITHLEALSRYQHALLDEHDVAQRKQRVRELLSYDPTVEVLPLRITSTTIGTLWGCRSDDVPNLLQKIQGTYPDEFFWRTVKGGRRGRKPAVFELRITSSLVERLCNEIAQQETAGEVIITSPV